MAAGENIVCPICHSAHPDKLFDTDSKAVVRHLLSADNMPLFEQCRQKVEHLWDSKVAAYYHCTVCTFEFAHPFIAGDADFYSFIYDTENKYPAEKWEYSISLISIGQFIKTAALPARLLEIGAGNGSFLKLLGGNLLPSSEIYSTELSEAGARIIGLMGFTCFQKDLQQISKEDLGGKVSIVCMFQVLEHLEGIHDLFEKLNDITFFGSRLYISVPNNLQRRFFEIHKIKYDLPPVHVGRYNVKSLDHLSEAHGWKVLRHCIQPSTYKQRILKFIYASYAKGQQVFNPEKYKSKPLRIFLRYCMLATLVFFHIRIIVGLRSRKLGVSQLFELERKNMQKI